MARVSVIIPLYNAKSYIGLTMESILNQTYQDFEILIIDDCSSDGSLKEVERMADKRVRILRNEKNMGIAYSRNRGLEEASGEYIALLDHDDLSPEYRLEHEVDFLDSHPDIMVVGGHERDIDQDGRDLNKQWNTYRNPKYIKAYMMFSNAVPNGAAMFRKSFVDRYHIRYEENMYGAEDYGFWSECALHGNIANLDEVMLYWRVGHGNVTEEVWRNKWEKKREVLRKIKARTLEKTGFRFEEEEIDFLCQVFMEEGIRDTGEGRLHSSEEIKRLYSLLQKLACQARELELENTKEIITMCRKRFGEKIGKAFFLWE